LLENEALFMTGSIGKLAIFPEEVRHQIWHTTDHETRVAVAQTSKQLNHEAGARSSAGVSHALDTIHTAFHSGASQQQLYTIHKNIIELLPRKIEDINSYRVQRLRKAALLHLPKFIEEQIDAQIKNMDLQHWDWNKLPITSINPKTYFTALSLLETRLLKFFHGDAKNLKRRKNANAQLASADAAHPTLHPMLYRMLSFRCPPAQREALAERAYALPLGKGAYTLQELAFSNNDELLEQRFREMTRTSAIALSAGEGCEILENLESTEHDLAKKNQLRLDIRNAAIAKPKGQGSPSLLKLLLTATGHTESELLLGLTHEHALKMPDGEAAEIIEQLMPFSPDPTFLKNLRAEILQHTNVLPPERRAPIFNRLSLFATDPQERTNLIHAALALQNDHSLPALIRLAATCMCSIERKVLRDAANAMPHGQGAEILYSLAQSPFTPINERPQLCALTRIAATKQWHGKGLYLLEKLRIDISNSPEERAAICEAIYTIAAPLPLGKGAKFLHRLLPYAMTQDVWNKVFQATVDAAALQPNGNGFATLCRLSRIATTPALKAETRQYVHDAACAQPMVIRAHSLYVLSLTSVDTIERRKLRNEAQKVALLTQHGAGAKTLYKLAIKSQSPMEIVQLVAQARDATLLLPRHARNAILHDLLRIAPTPELHQQISELLLRRRNLAMTSELVDASTVTEA
jgi:hypothetical protein